MGERLNANCRLIEVPGGQGIINSIRRHIAASDRDTVSTHRTQFLAENKLLLIRKNIKAFETEFSMYLTDSLFVKKADT